MKGPPDLVFIVLAEAALDLMHRLITGKGAASVFDAAFLIGFPLLVVTLLVFTTGAAFGHWLRRL